MCQCGGGDRVGFEGSGFCAQEESQVEVGLSVVLAVCIRLSREHACRPVVWCGRFLVHGAREPVGDGAERTI